MSDYISNLDALRSQLGIPKVLTYSVAGKRLSEYDKLYFAKSYVLNFEAILIYQMSVINERVSDHNVLEMKERDFNSHFNLF